MSGDASGTIAPLIVLLVILAAIVALVVIGSAVIGLAFTLLWWALVGLVIGALARLVIPGRQTMGLLATAASGVGGAILGGMIAHAIGVGAVLQFVIAVGVAAAIVAVVSRTERRYA